jgi:6-phosphogluconate dehydrogenase (decarboxylating)
LAAWAPDQFSGRDRVQIASDLKDLVRRLGASGESPIIWVMVPGGEVTNGVMSELSKHMRKGIVVDASNSLYTDSIKNHALFKAKGVSYLDVGCAGGPTDVLTGVTLMIGGNRAAFGRASDIFKTIAGKEGDFGYVGGPGSGHMTKLVHNIMFYGMFPIVAEGAELMQRLGEQNPDQKFDLGRALLLIARSPPVNKDMSAGVFRAYEEGAFEQKGETTAVSKVVSQGLSIAAKAGVEMPVTNSVISNYSSMSARAKAIFAKAKTIVTGH